MQQQRSKTHIKITFTRKRDLEVVIGTTSYKENYMNEKIDVWTKETQLLNETGKTEWTSKRFKLLYQ